MRSSGPHRQRKPNLDPIDDGDWPVDRGRPLGLRLLALLGALSFVMLGLSSLTPLLQPNRTPPEQTGTG